MTSKKAPPMPAIRRIKANSAFDPDSVAAEASRVSGILNLYCESKGLQVKFVNTMRDLDIYAEPADRLLAERNDPVVGSFFRYLRAPGWLSPSGDVVNRLTYEMWRDTNSDRRSWLDSKRNTKVFVEAERQQNVREEDLRRFRREVANGQNWIDRSIVQDGACRDVPAHVPARVPIALNRSSLASLVDAAPDDLSKRVRAPKKVKA